MSEHRTKNRFGLREQSLQGTEVRKARLVQRMLCRHCCVEAGGRVGDDAGLQKLTVRLKS